MADQTLEELKARRNELLLQRQGEQAGDAELIQDLAGRRTFQPVLPRPSDPTKARKVELQELKRRRADLLLQKQGKTPEQIQFVLDVNKKTKRPSTLGRTAGGIGGAIAATAALNLIPGFAVLPEEFVTFPFFLLKTAKTIAPIVGAGIGGGLGESVQINLEEKRRITKREFVNASLKEAAFEGGGRTFVRAGKFAFSPFIKQTVPEAAEITAAYGKAALALSPAQMDARLSLSIVDEIAKGGFGGKEVLAEAGRKSGMMGRVVAHNILDDMAGGFARMGKEQLGQELSEGFTRPTGFVYRQLDDIVNGLYKRFDELTESQMKRIIGTVEIPVLDKFGKPVLGKLGKPVTKKVRRVIDQRLVGKLSPGFEELEQFVPAGVSTRKLKRFWIDVLKKNRLALKPGRKGAFTLTSAAIKEGESTIRDLANIVPHKTMRNIRSRVLRDIRKLHRDVGQDEALIKRFEQITFDTLTDPSTVKGAPKEVQALFNNTRELYKSLRGSVETRFPEQVAKRLTKNPSSVIKEFFQQANPKGIREFRQSLIEPIKGIKSAEGERLWLQLRTAWFADAVEKATRDGVIKPSVYETALRTMTPEAVAEMIPDAAGKAQSRLIGRLLTAMSKKPSSGASLFIRSGQVGGLFMIYNGTKEGDFLMVAGGGALVAGPRFFAKMAAHPLGRKLLTSGIELKPGSTSLVPITARLVNLARQIDREDVKIGQKEVALRRVRKAQQTIPPSQQFRLRGLRTR